MTKIEKKAEGFSVWTVSREGVSKLQTKTLILATGCRERTAKQVSIHGTRPAGIYTAGTAQHFKNLQGVMPAKRCVILGSGDIGLIMARRLTLEGAKVLGVYEVKPEPSGLTRNMIQCLGDFQIPLYLSETVTRVFGDERLEGVEVCKVDEKMQPIAGTEKRIACDTLILSVGLIPDEMMCDLVEPGETIGHLTLQAAEDLGLNTELKLIATGTDKACEVLGLGCVNKKRAAISFGTTATITFTTDQYLEPENFIPPYDSTIPGHYTPEVEIFRGYWLISWFKKEFAQKEVAEAIEKKVQPEEILNQRLKEVPAGCGGLVLQPYFTPNLTMPEADRIIGYAYQNSSVSCDY